MKITVEIAGDPPQQAERLATERGTTDAPIQEGRRMVSASARETPEAAG